ncbi:MAG: site-specific DNA-methyltransferase [Verrucomicrobia bacterium]|nr:site-specific DNA-methyltransferase [Verrucomicrobiota bacterium]
MFRYTLTPRQDDILRFLVHHHRQTGLIASVREIQKHFNFSSSNAVAGHLRALEHKGYLARSKGKARSLTFSVRSSDAAIDADHGGEVLAWKEDPTQLDLGTLVAMEQSGDDKRSESTVQSATEAELDRATANLTSIQLDARTRLVRGDALDLLARMPANSITAIVTDPPYGLIEYDDTNHGKMREGRGGVWRIPPKFDGAQRSPLPRFTVLTEKDRDRLYEFFRLFGKRAIELLVPGGHLIIASNPLLSTMTFRALMEAGFEKRGEVIRLVTTLRGGDRPKGAEQEFPQISVLPRSCWEPWGLFRKALSQKTVAENLRVWSAGGLRRISSEEPFKDFVECPPARGVELELAPHPSLKPQRLMRYLVRASLPLGRGIVLDPFAGSGATLAAASAVGYASIGFERDAEYLGMASKSFAGLKALRA